MQVKANMCCLIFFFVGTAGVGGSNSVAATRGQMLKGVRCLVATIFLFYLSKLADAEVEFNNNGMERVTSSFLDMLN